jgi:hypothetical protein
MLKALQVDPVETERPCGAVKSFQFTAALVEPSYLDESRTRSHQKPYFILSAAMRMLSS